MDVERYCMRAKCGSCGAVLWTDLAQKVVCACSASWLEADGVFGGEAEATTDDKMIAFIESDQGRSVTLEQVE